MSTLTVVIILALISTIVTLVWGLGSMASGGTYDREHSEQLMFARVGLQAFAFIMMMVALYFSVA